jgi:hypothetical protein
MMENGTDYNIRPRDAEWLSGTVMLPLDIRRLSLIKFVEQHGPEALLEAFAQFMGLANSVSANGASMCSLTRIMDGTEHPDRPEERVNMPTPFGALQGAILAAKSDTPARCATCAFRLGTIANQSPITTADADYCSHPGEQEFFCHEGAGDNDHPTRACAGFAQARKERSA